MDFEIKYEQALSIVAARDKEYAEDIDRLITLLVKRPLGESIHPFERSNVGISASDHVIELYEKQVIKRAEKIVTNETIKHILQKVPASNKKTPPFDDAQLIVILSQKGGCFNGTEREECRTCDSGEARRSNGAGGTVDTKPWFDSTYHPALSGDKARQS